MDNTAQIKNEIRELLAKLNMDEHEYARELKAIYRDKDDKSRPLTLKELKDVRDALLIKYQRLGGSSFNEWLRARMMMSKS